MTDTTQLDSAVEIYVLRVSNSLPMNKDKLGSLAWIVRNDWKKVLEGKGLNPAQFTLAEKQAIAVLMAKIDSSAQYFIETYQRRLQERNWLQKLNRNHSAADKERDRFSKLVKNAYYEALECKS